MGAYTFQIGLTQAEVDMMDEWLESSRDKCPICFTAVIGSREGHVIWHERLIRIVK